MIIPRFAPAKPAAKPPPKGGAKPKAPPKARAPPAAGAAAAGSAQLAAAPEKRKRKAAEEIDPVANAAEVGKRFAAGELSKLNVAQVKAHLRAHKVAGGLGGAKPALLERLEAFLKASG